MVVEFFDYQCIWCSRLAPELEKVMKANTNVRYYFMEWPVYWQPLAGITARCEDWSAGLEREGAGKLI
ncbi:hypothetical protein ACJEDN_27950 [Klebsiella pneumoniae]